MAGWNLQGVNSINVWRSQVIPGKSIFTDKNSLDRIALNNTLTVHSDAVFSIAIAPDGQNLISVSEDKTIKIWNPQTRKLLRTLTKHDKVIESVAINPDGETFVSGGKDKIILWQLATGKMLRELPQSGFVRSVTFSPDGHTLISSHEDNTIRLWNLDNGKLLRTLSGHSGWVLSGAIAPDGQTLISGSRDKKIGIWNTR